MRKTRFLLVHGSWHGPWCWQHLQQALQERGHASDTVALPSVGVDPSALGGFDDDVAAAGRVAAAAGEDVVVVGHSYGGAVISGAAFGPNVRRLVFLAAFMPDSQRGYVSYLPPGPLPPFVGLRDDGTMAVPRELARGFFYHDCADDLAAWAETLLRPQSQAVLGGVVADASWRRIPSTYILAEQDRVLPPDFQAQFLPQAGSTRRIGSSHSPMLSMPQALADVLADIASA